MGTKELDKKECKNRSVKTAQEINDQIDASDKASESKSARVPLKRVILVINQGDQILAEGGDQWTI